MTKAKLKKLIRLYAREDNWHEIDAKTGNLGYGFIHYGLIRLIQAKRVLAIGSKYGYIPAVCAMACKDNNKGVVDFVDASYDYTKWPQDKNHWGGVGFWNKVDVVKHFGKMGLNKYIKLYLMTSKDFARTTEGQQWDYIYIDGDHSYGGVKNDFNLFYPRLKNDGYLLLHDIYTKNLGELDYGVNIFWEEIKKSGKYQVIEFSGKIGLGMIKKN